MVLLIVVLTFGCLALSVISVYFYFSSRTGVVTARLESMDPSLSFVEDNPLTVMAERVAEPLNRLSPISAVDAAKLQKKLLQAGFRSVDAVTSFRAVQVVLTIFFPSVALTTCFLLERPLNNFLIWAVVGAAFGFYLPRYVLKKKTVRRQQRITWGLADAMDLMVVAVEAGLGLNSAINRVSEELKIIHPDLHSELYLVNLEIRVGRSREEALRNLAERTGVDDIRSFVALLIQADRYGSSIGKAVRVFADSIRTKRRQRAEQTAHKAALKLVFPLTVFLFPVIILVILGSAILNVIDQFAK